MSEYAAAAGRSTRIVEDELAALRRRGHREAEAFANEGDDTLAIFEWSAPPGCDIHDRDGWAQANPRWVTRSRNGRSRRRRRHDPEWMFRTEVLCQWSNGTARGAVPARLVGAGRDRREPKQRSSIAESLKIGVGVDVSGDRSHAHIAFAGRNQYGQIHVEVVASRAGTDWVLGWLKSPDRASRGRWVGVAGQARGAPVSGLMNELETDPEVDAMPWQGSDLASACGKFYDLVRNNELAHLEQPLLDVAAATAVTKPLGDAWVWNRRHSPADCGPLVAATAAVWALLNEQPPLTSAYQDRGLMVV
jgi:hypothetical protein